MGGHWLIRGLMGQWAQAKAAEVAAEAVAKSAGSDPRRAPHQSAQAGQLPPADVGIVFALTNEAGGLVDRLEEVVVRRGAGLVTHEGRLAGRRVVTATSGPGRAAAGRAAEALLFGHRPRWMISAGFAGGLDPSVGRGDLLLADSIVDMHGGQQTVELALLEQPGADTALRWRAGRLLTVDRLVTSPDDKRRLGQQHAALAVDLETFAVAQVCRQRHVGFLAVRIINDPVDERLPGEVDHLMRQATLAARAGAVAGALWRRPSSAKDMWRLQQAALEASERLATFLQAIIGQLGKDGA